MIFPIEACWLKGDPALLDNGEHFLGLFAAVIMHRAYARASVFQPLLHEGGKKIILPGQSQYRLWAIGDTYEAEFFDQVMPGSHSLGKAFE